MAAAAENGGTAETSARPMNREEYLDSLRDGREIWIYGEKVEDVTTHPAFRNGVRSVARLYDGLHDPATKDVLTTPTDTGNGGYTHPYFKAPMSAEDLVKGRDAIAAWQRMTYGWMGRSPDYKAAFLATYGPNADYYAPYADNARRWYKEAQEKVFFMNHTLVNPPVDRNKDIHEVDDIFIHAVKETDEGVVVTGAKMVATGSAFSNYNFVSYHGAMPIKKKEYALSFFAPMNQQGTKLICRPSYEFMAATIGSPFDYPLSSRFDENDAVLVFEDALIPWENFLIYGNLEIASTYHLTGFIWRALLQGCTRLAVKLDFLAGLFIKMVEATGTIEFRGIQASIGEILAWRNMFWSLTDAMCHNPVPSANGSVLPNIEAASAYRVLSNQAYPGDQGDHREPDGWCADRASVELVRLEAARAAAAARPVLPRLERLHGCRQDQAGEAALGFDRQRVRRAARALRALVLGESRADEARVLLDGPGRRNRRPDQGLRGAVPGRVRPRRLDGSGHDRLSRRERDRQGPQVAAAR